MWFSPVKVRLEVTTSDTPLVTSISNVPAALRRVKNEKKPSPPRNVEVNVNEGNEQGHIHTKRSGLHHALTTLSN